MSKCPVCDKNKAWDVFKHKIAGFDTSVLYKNLHVVSCLECGHVYNKVSQKDIDQLPDYYENEYAAINLQSDGKGDLPGSSSPASIRRYDDLYAALSRYIEFRSDILDVGCALGGFMDYLTGKGYECLNGIDSNRRYVKEDFDGDRIYGDALNLPFAADTMDCIVMDQVLEHIADPRKAIAETRRVLRHNGTLCIAVPDRARYNYDDHFLFPYFWFIMREHIQHFNLQSLVTLCGREGFALETFSKTSNPMMSRKMILPNLIAVFKNTRGIIRDMSVFDVEEHLKIIQRHKRYNTPVYCWGIGREFFLLWELGLKHCNVRGLVDSNKHKQTLTVDGIPVKDPSVLKHTPEGVWVWITAYAHQKEIQKELRKMGIR